MCDTNDHGCNLKPEKLLSSLRFHVVLWDGDSKESETCKGILSHFCLKLGSEITFVNEKNLRNHPVVSLKLKPLELKPVKLTSSATQMSLLYKSSETVFFIGHFKDIQFSLTGGTK